MKWLLLLLGLTVLAAVSPEELGSDGAEYDFGNHPLLKRSLDDGALPGRDRKYRSKRNVQYHFYPGQGNNIYEPPSMQNANQYYESPHYDPFGNAASGTPSHSLHHQSTTNFATPDISCLPTLTNLMRQWLNTMMIYQTNSKHNNFDQLRAYYNEANEIRLRMDNARCQQFLTKVNYALPQQDEGALQSSNNTNVLQITSTPTTTPQPLVKEQQIEIFKITTTTEHTIIDANSIKEIDDNMTTSQFNNQKVVEPTTQLSETNDATVKPLRKTKKKLKRRKGQVLNKVKEEHMTGKKERMYTKRRRGSRNYSGKRPTKLGLEDFEDISDLSDSGEGFREYDYYPDYSPDYYLSYADYMPAYGRPWMNRKKRGRARMSRPILPSRGELLLRDFKFGRPSRPKQSTENVDTKVHIDDESAYDIAHDDTSTEATTVDNVPIQFFDEPIAPDSVESTNSTLKKNTMFGVMVSPLVNAENDEPSLSIYDIDKISGETSKTVTTDGISEFVIQLENNTTLATTEKNSVIEVTNDMVLTNHTVLAKKNGTAHTNMFESSVTKSDLLDNEIILKNFTINDANKTSDAVLVNNLDSNHNKLADEKVLKKTKLKNKTDDLKNVEVSSSNQGETRESSTKRDTNDIYTSNEIINFDSMNEIGDEPSPYTGDTSSSSINENTKLLNEMKASLSGISSLGLSDSSSFNNTSSLTVSSINETNNTFRSDAVINSDNTIGTEPSPHLDSALKSSLKGNARILNETIKSPTISFLGFNDPSPNDNPSINEISKDVSALNGNFKAPNETVASLSTIALKLQDSVSPLNNTSLSLNDISKYDAVISSDNILEEYTTLPSSLKKKTKVFNETIGASSSTSKGLNNMSLPKDTGSSLNNSFSANGINDNFTSDRVEDGLSSHINEVSTSSLRRKSKVIDLALNGSSESPIATAMTWNDTSPLNNTTAFLNDSSLTKINDTSKSMRTDSVINVGHRVKGTLSPQTDEVSIPSVKDDFSKLNETNASSNATSLKLNNNVPSPLNGTSLLLYDSSFPALVIDDMSTPGVTQQPNRDAVMTDMINSIKDDMSDHPKRVHNKPNRFGADSNENLEDKIIRDILIGMDYEEQDAVLKLLGKPQSLKIPLDNINLPNDEQPLVIPSNKLSQHNPDLNSVISEHNLKSVNIASARSHPLINSVFAKSESTLLELDQPANHSSEEAVRSNSIIKDSSLIQENLSTSKASSDVSAKSNTIKPVTSVNSSYYLADSPNVIVYEKDVNYLPVYLLGVPQPNIMLQVKFIRKNRIINNYDKKAFVDESVDQTLRKINQKNYQSDYQTLGDGIVGFQPYFLSAVSSQFYQPTAELFLLGPPDLENSLLIFEQQQQDLYQRTYGKTFNLWEAPMRRMRERYPLRPIQPIIELRDFINPYDTYSIHPGVLAPDLHGR